MEVDFQVKKKKKTDTWSKAVTASMRSPGELGQWC
jgi:hypothetical protein